MWKNALLWVAMVRIFMFAWKQEDLVCGQNGSFFDRRVGVHASRAEDWLPAGNIAVHSRALFTMGGSARYREVQTIVLPDVDEDTCPHPCVLEGDEVLTLH